MYYTQVVQRQYKRKNSLWSGGMKKGGHLCRKKHKPCFFPIVKDMYTYLNSHAAFIHDINAEEVLFRSNGISVLDYEELKIIEGEIT